MHNSVVSDSEWCEGKKSGENNPFWDLQYVCKCVCALVCACGSILQADNHCLSPDGRVYQAQQRSSCFLRASEVGGSSLCVSVCVCVCVCVCILVLERYWTVTYRESSRGWASRREEGEEAKLDRGFWHHQSTTLLSHTFSCLFYWKTHSVIVCV